MIIAILFIVGVVLLFYARALKYGYCIDDKAIADKSLKEPKPKNILKNIWLHLEGRRYDYPVLAHILALLLHLQNCLLIYFAFGTNNYSLLAALLFALNPALSQGSTWLSGKGYSIALSFTLYMYLFKWLTPLFYWQASLGASAILTPLIFLFTPFWFWVFLIPIFALVNRKKLYALNIHRAASATATQKKFNLKKIILFFKTLGYYFCLGLFPRRLGIYHTYLYCYGLSEEDNKRAYRIDIYFFWGLAAFVILGALLYFKQPAAFGMLWFIMFISQWCNLVTIQQMAAERYLYLPSAGLMYSLSYGLLMIPDPSLCFAAIAVVMTYYATRLYLHLPSYTDEMTQCEYNLINFPDMYACYSWKGSLERKANHVFLALEYWFKGWKLRKVDFRLNNNIAVTLTDLGRLADAELFLEQAEKNIIPEQREAAMSFINAERSRIAKAKEIIQKQTKRIITPHGR